MVPDSQKQESNPNKTESSHQKRSFFLSWIMGERAYARLRREFLTFQVDLNYLAGRQGSDRRWIESANLELERAREFLELKDVEGGWHCLHAAQRYAIHGLDSEQLADRAVLLSAEKQKLSPWRAKAIETLLSDKSKLTAERLIEATKLRDDHDANQYHKIWLTADQLGLLSYTSFIGLVFLAPIISYFHYQQFEIRDKTWIQVPPSPWGFTMVVAVLVLGMLGGAFSVVQSIITDTSDARIPERVANHWVTFIRALYGAVAGLAGYCFLLSNIVNIKIGDGKDSVAIGLTVAFLFGYAGERLIAKMADSVGASSKER